MTIISGASYPIEPAGNPGSGVPICPVVGIGTSAGGLEALETLFRNMLGDLGAAFVVVQHLAPRAPSILAELLRKVTPMPGTQARNNRAVRPNHVSVIPPNASLVIREGVLHVTIPGDARYAPVALREDGDGAVLQVKDTGIGMDQKTIRLPLDPDPPAAEPSFPAPAAAPQRLRILVIEDNEDAAECLQMLLELWGHQVDVAHDGPTGIDKARQFKPDVVLCDIGLPGDMDGYAVGEALRQAPAVAPAYLVAMTGYGLEEDKQRALAAGFDKHLTKPVDPSALQELLSRLPPRG